MVERPVDAGVESPDLLAACRIQREDDSAAGRKVEAPFDKYRIGLECEGLPVALTELPGSKSPGFFDLSDVFGRLSC